MPLFYIEMGQGIIASEIGLKVHSSALHTCTFIAAHNKTDKRAGAFHFPSGCINDNSIRAAMDAWIKDLAPTEVKLIYAQAVDSMMSNVEVEKDTKTPLADAKSLTIWLDSHNKLKAEKGVASNPAMAIEKDGTLIAGNLGQMTVQFDVSDSAHLEDKPAGIYKDLGGFSLFGRDENKDDKTVKKEPKGCFCTIM